MGRRALESAVAQARRYADEQKVRSVAATYRLSDGTVDSKRLPKAIQAILSNYRGTKVRGIPEKDIPAVLRRLADAAALEGRMPPRALSRAPIYQQLAQVLEQLGLSAS